MRAVVVLPTYNEVENIEVLLRSIRAATDADVLVVDDASPDGTADVAERLAGELGGIEVMRRSGKQGLGSAYRAGFQAVLSSQSESGAVLAGTDDGERGEFGYEVVISMDADLSHDPSAIPQMMTLLGDGADAVIGSRYVTGGGTTDWPIRRQLLSKWGNRYTRAVLGLRVNDCTSGFRAYRRDALAAIDPASTSAEGYAFLTELVRRLHRGGAEIRETPIIFRDRTKGKSKMSGRIIVESMALVTLWGVRDIPRRMVVRRT